MAKYAKEKVHCWKRLYQGAWQLNKAAKCGRSQPDGGMRRASGYQHQARTGIPGRERQHMQQKAGSLEGSLVLEQGAGSQVMSECWTGNPSCRLVACVKDFYSEQREKAKGKCGRAGV